MDRSLSPVTSSLGASLLGAALLMLATACGSTQAAQAAPPKKADGGRSGKTVVVTDRNVEINEGISMGSVKKAQAKLLEYDGQSDAPIWVILNSPGGSVDAGLILIDTMRAIRSPVYCVVESKAYSMAAIMLVFCDKRYGYPHSTYMLHEASYGTVGEDPSNRSKLDFLTRYLDRVHEEIAKRLKLELGVYRNKIRDAWWLLADEAEKIGLIDEIITDMTYYEFPVEKTEEKRTVTYSFDPEEQPIELPEIPKRRD